MTSGRAHDDRNLHHAEVVRFELHAQYGLRHGEIEWDMPKCESLCVTDREGYFC